MRAPVTLLMLGVLGGAGCGAPLETASPVMPATPSPEAVPGLAAGTVVVVVSGDTGAPVGGADLRVAGRAYVTDASGQVVLADPVRGGAAVEVVAHDFLPRRTRFESSRDARIALWPSRVRSLGVDEGYTRKLVYTASAEDLGAPTHPLLRLPTTVLRVSLVPEARIRAIPEAIPGAREAARLMQAAMGESVVFSVDEQPSGDVVIPMVIDPNAGCSAACAEVTLQGSEIRGGRIVFWREDVLGLRKQSVILHELGHAVGLGHSLRTADVMFPGVYPFGIVDFTDAEWLTIRMMLARRAGNVWPDDDPALSATDAAVRTVLIQCP